MGREGRGKRRQGIWGSSRLCREDTLNCEVFGTHEPIVTVLPHAADLTSGDGNGGIRARPRAKTREHLVQTARNGLVDYGRFIAALGIVWFQTQALGERIAYAALPLFLILLSMPFGADIATRARRLLVPFVIWSGIFAVVQVVFALKYHAAVFGWWEWHMLLTGTWMHLWLLPFAFLASLLAPWFQHPLASLGAALLTATLLVIYGTPVSEPFGQWCFGLIPVLVGLGFFAWGWRLAVTILIGSWLILHFGRPSPDNLTILVGTGLALVILSYRLPASQVSDWCARLSVWIYLAHPLAIIVGQSLRITWVELGLFALAGSMVLAQAIELILQSSRKGRIAL